VEEKEKAPAAPAAKGGLPKPLLIGLIVFALLAFMGGVAAGPMVSAKLNWPPYPKKEDHEEEPPAAMTMTLEGLVIDLRDKDGEMHHLKIGVAVELSKHIHEEELKGMEPRAKDATIGYLRTLSFDDVTNPELFERIRTELGERMAKALGKSLVKKILFTEYVAQ